VRQWGDEQTQHRPVLPTGINASSICIPGKAGGLSFCRREQALFFNMVAETVVCAGCHLFTHGKGSRKNFTKRNNKLV